MKTKTSRAELAKDMYLLSFFLVSINGIDIYNLQKQDYQDNRITYKRSKTKDRRRDQAPYLFKYQTKLKRYLRNTNPMMITYSIYTKDTPMNEISTKL